MKGPALLASPEWLTSGREGKREQWAGGRKTLPGDSTGRAQSRVWFLGCRSALLFYQRELGSCRAPGRTPSLYTGKRLGPIGQRRWTSWSFRGAVLAWNPLEPDWGAGELQLESEEKLILWQNQVRSLSFKSSTKGCSPCGHSQSPPPPPSPGDLSFVPLSSPSQSVQFGLSEQQ